ncbi:MAG TPA: hypothetical protein VLE96_07300 [Chlamydiales bacterium]|nr:hypothetical protein [Chlamydiales bacterium]
MQINNIHNNHYIPNTDNHSLTKELDSYNHEYKKLVAQYERDPTPGNLQVVKDFVEKMRNFLETNKSELFAIAKQNGWPSEFHNGEASYSYTFKILINNMDTFLNSSEKNPTSGIDFICEQFSQLCFFESTGELL